MFWSLLVTNFVLVMAAFRTTFKSTPKATPKNPNKTPFNQTRIGSAYLLTAKQRWSHVLLGSLPIVWYLAQNYHFFFDPLLNSYCSSTYRTEGRKQTSKKNPKSVTSTEQFGENRGVCTTLNNLWTVCCTRVCIYLFYSSNSIFMILSYLGCWDRVPRHMLPKTDLRPTKC